MFTGHTRIRAALTGAAVSLLAACAAPAPATPAAADPAPASTPRAEEKQVIVGSRIPVKSTEKLVREIGSTSAQDMQRNQTPNPGGHVQ